MLSGMIAGLLAEGDWGRLIGPLVLVAFYVISAILRSVSAKETKSNSETAASNKPRYKPLNDTAGPSQTTQVRTLPYARPARQGVSSPSSPIAQTTGELTDWDQQQQLKQQRLAQVEAFRRQQALEQQRQKIRQQAQLQKQREQQRQQAAMPAAVHVRHVQAASVRRASAQPRSVQAAGQGPRRQAVAQKTIPNPVPARAASVRGLLLGPGSLRAGIVLKEILDKPLALRNL